MRGDMRLSRVSCIAGCVWERLREAERGRRRLEEAGRGAPGCSTITCTQMDALKTSAFEHKTSEDATSFIFANNAQLVTD